MIFVSTNYLIMYNTKIKNLAKVIKKVRMQMIMTIFSTYHYSISHPNSFIFRTKKSCKDDILLTVDFNLRTRDALYATQVPQGRRFGTAILYRPCG